MSANEPADLRRIYDIRFADSLEYRRQVWSVLTTQFFERWISPTDAVLDLGCGYGEFINSIRCKKKYAMDLNPDAPAHLGPSVIFLEQDCSRKWAVEDNSLDVVFTSNFFEHLPDKQSLGRTLDETKRALRPGGRLIAMGPNIRFLPGAYWDFWDHHLPLTEKSLHEALTTRGFDVPVCEDRFLPYTMAGGPHYPLVLLRLFLRLKPAWRLLGKQFLVIGRKPTAD